MNVLTILAEGFADSSFARLFTEMQVLPMVLFIVGFIFCAIEVFVPGFGFFGISGTIMVVAGIVSRLLQDGDAMMLLYMITISLLFFFLLFFVFSRLVTKGKLSKTALFNVGTAVSEEKTEGTKDFTYLLQKEGVALTVLRPVGKANFGGEVVDVVARDGFINEGEKVVCIQVEGQRIVVINKQGE